MKGPGGSKQCSILNVYELWPSLSLSGQNRLLVLDPPLIPSQRICLLLRAPAASRLRSSRFTCRATRSRGAALRVWQVRIPSPAFPPRLACVQQIPQMAEQILLPSTPLLHKPSSVVLVPPRRDTKHHPEQPVSPWHHSNSVRGRFPCYFFAVRDSKKCLFKLGNTFFLLHDKQQCHSVCFCGERHVYLIQTVL